MKKATVTYPLIFLSILVAAFIAYASLSARTAPPEQDTYQLTPSTAKSVNESAYQSALAAQHSSIDKPEPTSLQNIRHEVTLYTDAQGNLLVNDEITQLFEFYLSAIGEEPLETLLARIQQELTQQLSEESLQQALGLLKRYVDYKIALTELNEISIDDADPAEKINAIRQQKAALMVLRDDHFSEEEHQAFFEKEEIYDSYMLDRLTITADASLDAETKQERLTALDRSLPGDVQVVRHKVSRHADLFTTTEAMKKSGASNEALFQVRAASLGNEAAEAMAKLDAERQQWQQRLNRYVKERNQLQQAGLSDEDKRLALNTYIDSNFSSTERLRVRALDSSM